MNNFRVRALLDRPSKQSLGMLGLVVEREPGEFFVQSVVGMQGKPMTNDELAELMASGDAQPSGSIPIIDADKPHAALWVGHEFAAKATRLGVPTPPLPKDSSAGEGHGTYWVAPVTHVWRVIDSWSRLAFRRAVASSNQELATLMAWAMPERDETRAAIWFTMRDKRKTNLDWWVRLSRDHGETSVTAKTLERRYDELVSSCQAKRLRKVYGFAAPAKGGDNEIAEEVSRQSGARRVSFGKWLREEATRLGAQTNRRALQRRGQHMIDTRGALEFCLKLLDSLPPHESIPDADIVIDGVRHTEVHDSLRCLIGADRFDVIYIDRPVAERRKALLEEEHIPLEEVDDVMNDITEREIKEVELRAARKFSHLLGVKPIARELAAAR